MSPVEPNPIVRRPLRYARDGLACFVLAVVGNVCASVTWEQYFASAPKPRISHQIYAATPVAAAALSCGVSAPSKQTGAPRLGSAEQAQLGQALPGESIRIESLSTAHPESASAAACPNGMRLVEGKHCPIVGHLCREFISVERDRCKEYVPNSPCVGKEASKRFCIDEFEYPNVRGARPLVGVNFIEASNLCKRSGKRLCSSPEWELACEGPARFPFPTGYIRDPSACNIDRPTVDSNNDAYAKRETRQAEIARLDQRETSGARPGCVSAYGVYDMTGNVDEWVINEEGHVDRSPYRSALKGGYWGRVRNRCRPTTTDHNAWHSGYQVGLRCCSDLVSEEADLEQRLALIGSY
jgi:hypothetical protein